MTAPPIQATSSRTTASTSSTLVAGSIEASTHPPTASTDHNTPSTIQRRAPHRTPATTGAHAPSPNGNNDNHGQRPRERRPPLLTRPTVTLDHLLRSTSHTTANSTNTAHVINTGCCSTMYPSLPLIPSTHNQDRIKRVISPARRRARTLPATLNFIRVALGQMLCDFVEGVLDRLMTCSFTQCPILVNMLA